jgi:hypothetical protein
MDFPELCRTRRRRAGRTSCAVSSSFNDRSPVQPNTVRDRLYLEEVHTLGVVPQHYWRTRKQTREEFHAEMAARGVDMSASKRAVGIQTWNGGSWSHDV